MPFVADLEARDEPRGPLWGPFALIRDNVERFVALNLAWSAQLVPGLLALAFPQLPLGLRVVMGLYSATIAIPATGTLYALVLAATRGELLSVDLARDLWREIAIPSFRVLAPLFGLFGLLIWLALLVGSAYPVVTTLATLIGLLWYLCATYWGPLLASDPHASMRSIAVDTVTLVLRFPLETLATALVAAMALLIGFVSIGGLFLIVPVAVTLLQTLRLLDLMSRVEISRVRSTGSQPQ
jgi:hypothetical protein